ncbi:MAG: hypothetical protein ACRBN8_02095 [Nannocystales bacterium]
MDPLRSSRCLRLSYTLAAVGLCAGCTGSGSLGSGSFGAADTEGEGEESEVTTGVVSSGEASSTAQVDTSETGEGRVLLDVGGGQPPDTADPDAGIGCSKADILFVVDDSPSMASSQSTLVGSIPGFVDTLRTDLDEISSLHVGVVSTGAFNVESPDPPECDTLGALVTAPGGANSSNTDCGPFVSGGRYMTEDDDLTEALSCALLLGTSGSTWQRPIDSARNAIAPALNAAGACNDGFIRDDALLVIVLITDIDDFNISQGMTNSGSMGGPVEWVQDVVDRKGREEHVAVVSVVPTVPPNACDGLLDPKDPEFFSPADRIIAFTRAFTHGVVGDICEPDFSAVLGDAIDSIEAACMDFVPEG